MARREVGPLPFVLADLALVARGLVVMRGTEYWRIEDASAQARREAASGNPSTRNLLKDPVFSWDVGPDNKIVILKSEPAGQIPYAVEVGSQLSHLLA